MKLSTHDMDMKQIFEDGRMIARRQREKILRWKPNNFWDVVKYAGNSIDLSLKVGNKDSNFDGIDDYWKDQVVIVIGNAKELDKIDLNSLNDLNTIGCNHLIDKWDKMKIFVVQDNRFFDFTKYDFNNFSGLIFCHNRVTKIDYSFHSNLYFFFSSSEPKMRIMDGMYSRKQTGTNCINLALILGAKKIYLLGMGGNKDDAIDPRNHINNYVGLDNTTPIKDYKNTTTYKMINLCKAFLPYKDKIINVSDNPVLDYFNSIKIDTFKKLLQDKKL